jgi:hypothetical protein
MERPAAPAASAAIRFGVRLMTRFVTRAIGPLVAAVLIGSFPEAHTALRAEITLVAVGTIPGNATDRSGLTGTYTSAAGETIPANQFGSFGSAITYSGTGNRYYATNDRGFGDGSTRSVDRFHVLNITVDPARKRVNAHLVETRFLTDEAGQQLVGLAAAFAADPRRSLRFDPEGLRVGPQGTLFISDEYGPAIDEFTASGMRLRSLPIPAKFRVGRLEADEDAEIAANRMGRVTNKGMEGLAITPDGRTLVGLMQGPLIQDGGKKGIHCRILTIDADSGKTYEYIYSLSMPGRGTSEILALGGDRFLVLERDSAGGRKAFARLFQIDLRGASDVSGFGTDPDNGLPQKELPAGVTPVAKKPFLDLLDPRFGLAADDFPTKIEGLTWGPDLADGRRLLLVTSDNDLIPKNPSYIYAFAIDRADLE